VSTSRPVQLKRHRSALIALLAAASLLGGAQALAPSPALALNDENDECAQIVDPWEKLQCEQDKGGTGSGTGSSTDPSGGDTTGADTGETLTPPSPIYQVPPIFDHTFDSGGIFFDDWDVATLSKTYAHCNRIWQKARRATHRRRHRVFAWLREDPEDSWIQDYLHEQWVDNDCGDVFDTVGRP
jgi:hypothetical protein